MRVLSQGMGIRTACQRRFTSVSLTLAKRSAAHAAVDRFIATGDKVIGVGSGSTVPYVVDRLAELEKTAVVSRSYVPTMDAGLRLSEPSQHASLDITFDGADEIDPHLNAIKGGGGCHLQEKVVAAASKRWIMVADSSKQSTQLGLRWTKGIPIEVVPFAYLQVQAALTALGASSASAEESLSLRTGTGKAGPVVTDNGNFLIDAVFSLDDLKSPVQLAGTIKNIPGVVEVGLFCGLADAAVFGNEIGAVDVILKASQ